MRPRRVSFKQSDQSWDDEPLNSPKRLIRRRYETSAPPTPSHHNTTASDLYCIAASRSRLSITTTSHSFSQCNLRLTPRAADGKVITAFKPMARIKERRSKERDQWDPQRTKPVFGVQQSVDPPVDFMEAQADAHDQEPSPPEVVEFSAAFTPTSTSTHIKRRHSASLFMKQLPKGTASRTNPASKLFLSLSNSTTGAQARDMTPLVPLTPFTPLYGSPQFGGCAPPRGVRKMKTTSPCAIDPVVFSSEIDLDEEKDDYDSDDEESLSIGTCLCQATG